MATVAVDFDGPLHGYSRGWTDGSIYDPPTEGALEAIESIMGRHAAFVHTTRDAEQVATWLSDHDVPATTRMPPDRFWNTRGLLLVTDRKLPASAYIDDRAVHFESWPQALTDLRRFVR